MIMILIYLPIIFYLAFHIAVLHTQARMTAAAGQCV
jgi:hypothetical protein